MVSRISSAHPAVYGLLNKKTWTGDAGSALIIPYICIENYNQAFCFSPCDVSKVIGACVLITSYILFFIGSQHHSGSEFVVWDAFYSHYLLVCSPPSSVHRYSRCTPVMASS